MKKLTIAFVDVFGLPYDGDTLNRRGLGGSESAIIHMSRELAAQDFSVTVFCDCTRDDANPGVYNGVTYRPLAEAETTEEVYDIMISSRSVAPFAPYDLKQRFKSFVGLPNTERMATNAGYRVLWMHDTFCDGDDLIEDFCLQGRIHRVFTLSDWHTNYVTNCNHGKPRNYEVLKQFMWQTRNGIVKYADWTDIRHKDPNLFVFNSSVTKGMVPLIRDVWPEFKARCPSVKLKVLGGYYKFPGQELDEQQRTFEDLRAFASAQPDLDIEFTGIVTQREVAEIMQNASYMIYPALFPETYGISVLEALAYNTPVITNTFGALESIAIDSACYKIPYAVAPNGLFPHINQDYQIAAFVEQSVNAYSNSYLHQQKQYACNSVRDICTWDTVALQWKQHFYAEFEHYLSRQEFRAVCDINARVREVFGIRHSDPVVQYLPRTEENHITVVIPFYNAEKYLEKCLHSVLSQDYSNYEVIIINDASTDASSQVVAETVSAIKPKVKIQFMERTTNMGAVYNQIEAIRNCGDNDIVMIVDGDDWLVADNQIFHRINNMYNDGAEFTYGSCWSLVDNIPLVAQPYPPEIKQDRAYRDYLFNWNMPYTHLRTFRAHLLKSKPDSDFQDNNGEWYKAGGDTSVFYGALESADPDKVVCVPDILYVYNDTNPLNDYKINGDAQTRTANQVLKKKEMAKLDLEPIDGYTQIDETIDGVGPWQWLEWDLQTYEIIKGDWPGLKDTILRNVKNFGVCVQAGGNQGMYPALLSQMFERVYTFEPHVHNYRGMLYNIDVDRVIPRQAALGAYTGTVKCEYGHPGNSGTAKCEISEDGDVPLLTIDSLNLDRCDLIQLDLEGFEMYALMGGMRTIQQFKPVVIAEGPERNNDTVTHIMEQLGYELVDMTGSSNDTVYVHTGRPAPFREGGLPYTPQQKVNPNPKKILIAIPTARNIEVETFKAIHDLEVPEGYEVEFQYFYGYRIDQVRNLIADWMVKGPYDYLFSVDSDISFPADTLKRFLMHDRDVVTGVYRQRKADQHIIEIYNGMGQNIDWPGLKAKGDASHNNLVEVGGCGFGCVLIKKSVFTGIPYPHFEYHVALDHSKTLSEDVDFCRKATDRGFTVWVDTTVTCGHIGSYNFQV